MGVFKAYIAVFEPEKGTIVGDWVQIFHFVNLGTPQGASRQGAKGAKLYQLNHHPASNYGSGPLQAGEGNVIFGVQ
jgi:hypothetical protein